MLIQCSNREKTRPYFEHSKSENRSNEVQIAKNCKKWGDAWVNKQELIQKLKEARKAKNLSYQDIVDITEVNGEAVSMSTVRRVFTCTTEEAESFKYNQTLRPIVRAVLGMDEETTPPEGKPTEEQVNQYYAEVEALKALVEFKSEMLARAEEEARKKIEFLRSTVEDYRESNKWYKRIIGVLGAICALAVIAVIADIAIGSIGWIRY